MSHPLYQSVHLHFQDESRLGLITEGGRKITAKGIKPVGVKQFQRQNFYLYGTVTPLTGQSFFVELPYLDLECFQIFMDEFAKSHRKGLHIIVVDRASCHMSAKLKLPSNVVLLPLPPYSPELNPIERFWQELKRVLKWRLFDSLDNLKEDMWNILKHWPKRSIRQTTFYPFIQEALIT